VQHIVASIEHRIAASKDEEILVNVQRENCRIIENNKNENQNSESVESYVSWEDEVSGRSASPKQ
jgi:hypothetical protein